jgi:hypothetical protein
MVHPVPKLRQLAILALLAGAAILGCSKREKGGGGGSAPASPGPSVVAAPTIEQQAFTFAETVRQKSYGNDDKWVTTNANWEINYPAGEPVFDATFPGTLFTKEGNNTIHAYTSISARMYSTLEDADKLNGAQWKGNILYFAHAKRDYYLGQAKVWQPWEDFRPGDIFSLTVSKGANGWSATDVITGSVGTLVPIQQSELPEGF